MLYAAYIRDNYSRMQKWKHLLDQGAHLSNRRAKHNQVGAVDRLGQVQSRLIDGAFSLTLFDAGRSADKSGCCLFHSPFAIWW